METRLLNMQADRIEMVLAAHKAPARVLGGRLTPRTVEFHLAPAAHTRLTRLHSLTDEVALALGASSARLTRTNGTLSLELQRENPSRVSLAGLNRQLERDDGVRRALACAGTAILGVDSEGVPLLLRLASPDVAHCLIAGTTGSGKTELARTLVASLVMHQRPHDILLALFDPKARGLKPFERLPHLLFPLACDPAEIAMRLGDLVDKMERREREGSERPRIVVVVDELADLLQTSGPEVEAYLTRLLQRGRSAGISVVACTQKPSADAVGALLRANFPVRIVGRVASADDARVAAGVGGTGAERLRGRGDFVLLAGGQRIRFQGAQMSANDLEAIAAPRVPQSQPRTQSPGLGQLRRVK